METIQLYDAISEMRKKSKKEEVFSISFMSYSISRNDSHGIRKIDRARLRKSEIKGQYKDFMLSVLDVETKEPIHIWQPLIMFYNNKKVVLTWNLMLN